MANLQANLPNFFIAWPSDATLTLIRRRRHHQRRFSNTRLRDQGGLWLRIASHINRLHTNYFPTATQCRNKWNALKSGFENLQRLNDEENVYTTHAPSYHDYEFHTELSDEFWKVECN